MLRPRESRDLRLISSHVTVAVSSHPCTAFGANPKRENAPVAAAMGTSGLAHGSAARVKLTLSRRLQKCFQQTSYQLVMPATDSF